MSPSEYQGIVTQRFSAGEFDDTPMSQVIQVLLHELPVLAAEVADYYLPLAQMGMREVVFRAMRRATLRKSDESRQLLLGPEFQHAQQRYVIEREGESVVVRIFDMTDDELEAKAVEHEKQGDGHFEHAAELRRFMAERD